ncbi:MAG TPA: type III-A CRISPR-associated RAMP protein Csm5 [Bacteroidetes bacterium]|nr:type III-A CRISPR-associated RAMP protein Csm5 [Bacteroidota bacterium]
MKTMELKIKVKTPLHIGDHDSRKWSAFSDYIAKDGKIQFVDARRLNNLLAGDDKLMDAYLQMIRRGQGRGSREQSLGAFLSAQNIPAEEVISTLSLQVSGIISGREIKPFIARNGKPFIPGSSLKGAIRSTMAYDYVQHHPESKRRILNDILKKNQKPDFRKFEQEIFGSSPHTDLLRFLHAGDSSDFDPDDRFVQTTWTYHIKKGVAEIPISKECLKPDAEAFFRIKKLALNSKVHEGGFRTRFEKLNGKEDLFHIVNAFALRFAEREIEELNGKPGLEKVVNFYQKLISEITAENGKKAFLMLGAGTGIFTKTILLIFSSTEIERIRESMKETKASRNFGWVKGKRSELFPVTRHVYMSGDKVTGILGWVEIY